MADQPVIDRFREWMSERRLPLTPQRLAIASKLLGSNKDLAAEDVVAALAANGVKVGTATVYRTIDVLLDGGFIIERNRGEGFRRFAANLELPHHEQLLCTVCGAVEEFREASLERMTSRVAESHGFERERHRLVIYGTCAACRSAAKAAGAHS